MRKDLHDPYRVASADVCNLEVLGFDRNGRVQYVLEAVKPEPVLEDEPARVLVATVDVVYVVVLLGSHVRRCFCQGFAP